MILYLASFLVTFAVLIFLRFCEGSPFRTWKAVVLLGIPLALLAGYYFNHAFPAKAPPKPQVEKASAYRAELERTCRRIAGVRSARIDGTTVEMDFSESKPLSELKRIAGEVGGTASYFLRTNAGPIAVKIKISVAGQDRYQAEYLPGRGVWNEQEF